MISFEQVECYVTGMCNGDNDDVNIDLGNLMNKYIEIVESPTTETFLSFLQGNIQNCQGDLLPFLQKIEQFIVGPKNEAFNRQQCDFDRLIGDNDIVWPTYQQTFPTYTLTPAPTIDPYKITCEQVPVNCNIQS